MQTDREPIRVGSIVTAILEAGGRFVGKQGVVVGIKHDKNPDGPIGVKFPAYYDCMNDFPEKHNTIIRFDFGELRKDEFIQPLYAEKQLDILFGRSMWHSYGIRTQPMIPGLTDCEYQRCEKKAIFAIWVNIWGTAYQFYVCPKHAEYHGRNCEDFPAKKNLDRTTTHQPLWPLILGETKCAFKECKKYAHFTIPVHSQDGIFLLHVCGKHARFYNQFVDHSFFEFEEAEKERAATKQQTSNPPHGGVFYLFINAGLWAWLHPRAHARGFRLRYYKKALHLIERFYLLNTPRKI